MKIDKVDQYFKTLDTTSELRYFNPQESDLIEVYGLAWFKQDRRYVRFPQSSDNLIKELADGLHYLVNQPSGAMMAFYSNTKNLKIKVTLGHSFNMAHMANTGQGGFDLYIGNNLSDLTFVKTSSFYQNEYQFTLIDNWEYQGEKLFCLNFPLYASVEKVEVGIDNKATIAPATSLFKPGRIVWYGTSITQGGCASRPGINPSNALSRIFGHEFINLGFSGNGRGQIEVAELISQIDDTIIYLVDYEGNAKYDLYSATLEPFIKLLRQKNPLAVIIVISKTQMAIEYHQKAFAKLQNKSRLFAKNLVKELSQTDPYIYFIDGHDLLGPDDLEATVDGTHPTDLGFSLITQRLAKKLTKYL